MIFTEYNFLHINTKFQVDEFSNKRICLEDSPIETLVLGPLRPGFLLMLLAVWFFHLLCGSYCGGKNSRGSETVGPVGPVGHRDLRSDPDTGFAGPNVRERSRKPI